MTREDVALHPEHMVPDDADLKRMLVYRTAGTTGHAILVPHHARAVASYQPMMEHVLRRYGIRPRFTAQSVACFLICSQRQTVTWAATLSYWKGAGFAKVNLNPSEWPTKESPQKYISELAPQFLTGDPFSYSDLLRLEVPVRPSAMFTTAVAMRPGLKRRLVEQFACPIIDWFSLIETGPIGYACPQGDAYHIMPHDIHVEVLDENEHPVPPGVRGEITVTGGRNPCLPLIRYRTRDWGTLDFTPCSCGDPMPRIIGLEGRTPMNFRTADGSLVNSADLSRILREFPLVQHEFRQKADLTCEITIRPITSVAVDEEQIRTALQKALGNLPIELRQDPELGNELHTGKVISYQSELMVND